MQRVSGSPVPHYETYTFRQVNLWPTSYALFNLIICLSSITRERIRLSVKCGRGIFTGVTIAQFVPRLFLFFFFFQFERRSQSALDWLDEKKVYDVVTGEVSR